MSNHPPQKPKPLGQHQSSWIWGRHLVWETIAAGRWPVLELWVAEDLSEADFINLQRATSQREIIVQRATRKSLVSKCRGEDHQGYAARMAEFPYQSLESTWDPTIRWPFYVLLDRIQDPFNFGTMLRSAEVFGAQGVLIGSQEQTGVTSQVARSSVGAVNRLPIIRVTELTKTVRDLQQRQVVIVGASEKAEQALSEFDFRQPVAVIIGNEGRGMSPELARTCDALVRIPQKGMINSLNAAAALAIFCYEIRRQQSDLG